ncbi:unnamed protein product [Ascophyllum nodosum]
MSTVVSSSRWAQSGAPGGSGRKWDAEHAIRIHGHDNNKPCSSHRRFEKMAQETRGLFFSVISDSGNIHEDLREKQQKEAQGEGSLRTPGASAFERPRFRATFGNAGAWVESRNYGITTEGPYTGRVVNVSLTDNTQRHLFLNPKGWVAPGAKEQAWQGAGEGEHYRYNNDST